MFLHKKEKNSCQKNNEDAFVVANLFIATTDVISSYNDRSGGGPRCIKIYLVVTKKSNKYFEVFSGREIDMKSNCTSFNVPYIKEMKPFSDVLNDPHMQFINKKDVFDFILYKNIAYYLKKDRK